MNISKAKNLLILVGGIVVGMLLGLAILMGDSWFSGGDSHADQVIETGRPAPGFSLPDLKGNTVKLSDYRGKAVVLNFWAVWCPPCRTEMPLLEKLAQDNPERLVVVGVNISENQPQAQEFVSEYGLTFPILIQGNQSVHTMYQVRGFPTTFFIDSEGVLQAVHVGELNQRLLSGYLQTVGISQ